MLGPKNPINESVTQEFVSMPPMQIQIDADRLNDLNESDGDAHAMIPTRF